MRREGGVEHALPLGNTLLSSAVVHVCRRQHSERDMMVLVILPGEKVAAVGAGVLYLAKAVGEASGT